MQRRVPPNHHHRCALPCRPTAIMCAEQPKKRAVCQVPGCDHSLHKLRNYYKVSAGGCWWVSLAARQMRIGHKAIRGACGPACCSDALPARPPARLSHVHVTPLSSSAALQDLPLPFGAALPGGGGPDDPLLPAVRPLPAAVRLYGRSKPLLPPQGACVQRLWVLHGMLGGQLVAQQRTACSMQSADAQAPCVHTESL